MRMITLTMRWLSLRIQQYTQYQISQRNKSKNRTKSTVQHLWKENKQAQAATEQEILDCQNEVEDEEIRIAASATSYKNIQDWAAKFEGAPLDIKKMILARMIEKITVDRDYNIEIHFFVTVEDFDGKVASAS